MDSMKSGTTSHIKFKNLKRMLGRRDYEVVGILQGVWNLACEGADDGAVGRYSNDEIAAYLEWDGDADTLIDSLVACRWLDPCDKDRLVVHDWEDHKPNFIKKREYKRKERRHDEPCRPFDGDSLLNRGDSRQKNGDRTAKPNPTQPSQTKPNPKPPTPFDGDVSEPSTKAPPITPKQAAPESPPLAAAIANSRTPPEFDESLDVAWARIQAAQHEATPKTSPMRLTSMRRYALAEALRSYSIDQLVDAFRWCLLSANDKAASIRSKWRGIDTLLDPNKTAGYVEVSEAPGAWERAPPPDIEADERAIRESLDRTRKGIILGAG